MDIVRKIVEIISILGFLFPCEGDTNLDELVNVQDIVLTVSHILGTELLEDLNFSNADANNDEVIDILDIVIIVGIVLSENVQCEVSLDLILDWEFADDLSYFDSEELDNVISQISNLSYIEGIIVVHNGRIVSESYYNGSSVNQTFNIWSVTKSFTSTLVGQAIDQGYIDNQYLTLNNLLPTSFPTQPYLYEISLHNLLSMSSGYADGFVYPYWVSATTTQLEWMSYTSPGFFFYNNSACQLNSHILYYATQMTPSEFANINLFPYLGIENPQWLDGYLNINDGSASLELNLRDMIKLGQLYLQDGYSGDTQILSSEWIQEATSLQISTGWELLPGYGYLWWLPQEGYLAFGYGGQFIAVLPNQSLVVGTHSNIYSTESYQTQLLDYILNDITPIFDGE